MLCTSSKQISLSVTLLELLPSGAGQAAEGAASTFELGELPVSAHVKYFHGFGAENRIPGNAVFLTVAFPLSIGG